MLLICTASVLAKWVGKWFGCRGDDYVVGMSLKSLPEDEKNLVEWDDWAATNLRVKCKNGGLVRGDVGDVDRDDASWSSWSEMDCPSGKYLCGVRARLDTKDLGDDETGLNQLQPACCDLGEGLYQSITYRPL